MVAMVLLVTNLPSVSANEQLAPGTTSEARGPAPLGCQPRQTKRAERPLLAAGCWRRAPSDSATGSAGAEGCDERTGNG
jgi:hypothetical protein